MRQFWTLTLVQLRGLLGSAFAGRKKHRRRSFSGPIVVGLAGLGSLLIGLAYSFAIAAGLGAQGNSDMVLVVMPLLAAVLTVSIGGQGAASFVFGGKDSALLLAMPIPPTTLAAAKISAILAENLLFVSTLVLPAGLAHAVIAGGVPWWFWPLLVPATVFFALLTTTLSILVGMATAFVRSRTTSKLLTNVASLLLMMAVLGGYLWSQTVLRDQLRRDPGLLPSLLSRNAPPLLWIRDAAVHADPVALALLAAVGVLPLAAVTWWVGRSFIGLVSRLSARRGTSRAADLDALRVRTPLAALVRREVQRFFGVNVFFLNASVGLLFLLAGAGYLLVVGDLPVLREVAAVTHSSPGLLLALAAVFTMTTVITTPGSVALEGDRLWILKEAPVSPMTVLTAKLLFHLAVTLPIILPAALAVGLRLRLSAGDTLSLVALPALASLAIGLLGLAAGLAWPNLDAPNDTAAVKQGVGVVATMVGGMGLAVLVAVAAMTAAQQAPGLGAVAAGATLVVVVAALGVLLRTWGVRAFTALG